VKDTEIMETSHELRCYWCGGTQLKLEYGVNGYTLYKCSSCSLAKIYPTPDALTLASFYTGADSNLAKGNAANEIEAFLQNPEQAIRILREARLEPLYRFQELWTDKRKVVADVGCGGGTFLAALRQLGFTKLVGIEPNPTSVHLIRERLGICVFESPTQYLTEGPQADVLTMVDVLEHVADPVATLRQLNQMTRNEGGLHIRVPNYGSLLSSLFGARWLWALPPYHLNYFTPAVLGQMIAGAGFRIEGIWTANSGYYLALFSLQLRKFLTNSVELPSPRTRAYSKTGFCLINLAEQFTRMLCFPWRVAAKLLQRDDVIHVIARKESPA
jgi:2-polyprenyl-3-methyl-5-hydroxy-6-metoxy-1,4-benzoquinol methylase